MRHKCKGRQPKAALVCWYALSQVQSSEKRLCLCAVESGQHALAPVSINLALGCPQSLHQQNPAHPDTLQNFHIEHRGMPNHRNW